MKINQFPSELVITPTEISDKCVNIYVLVDINSKIIASSKYLSFKIKDGYYRIYELMIPKLDSLDIDDLFIRYPNYIVYYNGEIQQYLPESKSVKSIDYNTILNLESNIDISYTDIFQYQNLENCLQEYLKAYNGNFKLKDLDQPDCADCRNISKDDLLKRINYITTILNMIKYYVQCMNYNEAQKLINLIPYCNVRREDNY